MDQLPPAQWSHKTIKAFMTHHASRFQLSRGEILGQVPEFSDAVERLQNGDHTAIEWALVCMEVDPWHHRSGYLKGNLAQCLRRFDLSPDQVRRLQEVIVRAICRPRRVEEFREYTKLARRIETPSFRRRLAQIASQETGDVSWRASHVLSRCEMNDYRENLRVAGRTGSPARATPPAR